MHILYTPTTNTYSIGGAVLIHTAYNTDATNFPAGAVNASKALVRVGVGSCELVFQNRTSPAVNSNTYWTYDATIYFA